MSNKAKRTPHVVKLCGDCPDYVRPEFSEAPPVPEATTPEATFTPDRTWGIVATVEKYAGDWTAEQIAAGEAGEPYEVYSEAGNLLTTVGSQRLLDLMIGASSAAFTNAASRLGVGNSATAAAIGNTDLAAAAGAGNRQFKVMDATYPSRSGSTVTYRATFTTGEANFAWLEWCIDRGTASGTTVTAPMLNRKVPSGGMGTKSSGLTWALAVAITIT
jgi:hypothetical protein